MQQPTQNNEQPKAQCLNNIAITGIGLHCAAGTEPVALFGAVATNLGYIQPDPVLEAPSVTGEGVENIMTCAMENLDEEDPNDRMIACMFPALVDAIDDANLLGKARKKILVYLVLPSLQTARGDCLLIDEIHELLSSELEDLGDIDIRIKEADQTVTEHLIFVCQQLEEGNVDTVLFGAVDSLVDELTCMELGKAMRIQTLQTSEGVVPGEAAGCIVLEQITKIRKDERLPYGWLKGLAIEHEPNHNNADLARCKGLNLAMNALLTACALTKDRISTLTLALGTEQTDMIEWYQTEEMLWPHRASEQEATALRLGEVDMIDPVAPETPEKLYLNQSLGDIGVASAVVSIILAAARFDFAHPVCKRNLILESGHNPHRGVIYVKHPTSGKQINQKLDEVA